METNNCNLCPRGCLVDRTKKKTGYCGQTDEIRLARAALHFWEEPCISGKEGSGTVFFSGCTLRCIYCQNEAIASGSVGKVVSVERLSEIFLELEKKGANNINLVTPGHFVLQIRDALILSKEKGLVLPVVYNSSGYERVEALRLLEGLIDIYLPDFKYVSSKISREYSAAPDYFTVAKQAIEEMVRQVGKPVFKQGTERLEKGVVVRHLILPGSTKDSEQVLQYLLETYGDQIIISILSQYTPLSSVKNHPLLYRKITKREHEKVLQYAITKGLEFGYFQERNTALESFIPAFDYEGVE